MSPQEIAEMQLGQLIHDIGMITWDHAMSVNEAIALYETIKPSLEPMQCDAWQIIIDLMYQEAEEEVA